MDATSDMEDGLRKRAVPSTDTASGGEDVEVATCKPVRPGTPHVEDPEEAMGKPGVIGLRATDFETSPTIKEQLTDVDDGVSEAASEPVL